MNNAQPFTYTFLCPPGGSSSVAPIVTRYFLCPVGATHIRTLTNTNTLRVAPTGHMGSCGTLIATERLSLRDIFSANPAMILIIHDRNDDQVNLIRL